MVQFLLIFFNISSQYALYEYVFVKHWWRTVLTECIVQVSQGKNFVTSMNLRPLSILFASRSVENTLTLIEVLLGDQRIVSDIAFINYTAWEYEELTIQLANLMFFFCFVEENTTRPFN